MSRGEEIRKRILAGERVINKEGGNSMTPILKSRQPVELRAVDRPLKRGDIVYAKVKGRFYTHKITAIAEDGRVQIGNNHGHINGWTRDIIALATPLEEK